MEKNKIVRFIVPIISCCLVVVACVIPAKAVTSYPNDPSYRQWIYQAVTSGDVTAIVNIHGSDDILELNQPLANVTIDSYTNLNTVTLTDSFINNQTGQPPLNLQNRYSIIEGTFVGFGSSNNHWLSNNLNFGLRDFTSDNYYVDKFVIRFDSFSLPVFNQDAMSGIMRLFALEGCGLFKSSFTLKYVGDDNTVHDIVYQTETRHLGTWNDSTGYYSSTASTWLDWNDMLAINSAFGGNYNDGRILIENAEISYEPMAYTLYLLNDACRIRVFASPLETTSGTPAFSGPYPNNYYDAEKFYTSNNIIYTTQSSSGGGGGGGTIIPPADNAFGDFLVGTIGAVFDTPMFGNITLGNILNVILCVFVILWIFKVFAGG